MENLLQDINFIIKESNDKINIKITGLNYLEKIKYLIIDKLKNLNISDNSIKPGTKLSSILKIDLRENLSIILQHHLESISKLKKNISDNSLFLVLHGSQSFEIFSNSDLQKSTFLNLYPNTGLIISKGTKINQLISKDSLIVLISIVDEKNIEKL